MVTFIHRIILMDKGSLIFDPVSYKLLEKRNRRMLVQKRIIATTLISCLVLSVAISAFVQKSDGFESTYSLVQQREAVALCDEITSLSDLAVWQGGFESHYMSVHTIGISERKRLVELALENERLAKLEQERKEQEALKAKLAAVSPKPTTPKPATTASAQPKAVGGDNIGATLDHLTEVKPVNPEIADPNGNYGIVEFWPMPERGVDAPYGYLPERGRMHYGIDIGAPFDTPICAAGAGKVIRSEWFAGYGNCIDIQHASGYITRYGHLNSYYVQKGQFVNAGDWIGGCGSTGNSTGPHLHFEIHVNGSTINPESSSIAWSNKP